MSLRFKIICLIALVCTTMACDRKRNFTASGHAAVEDSVRATLGAYCDAVRSRGLMAELDYLDASDSFDWIPPGFDSPIGYDSVVSILKRYAPALRTVDNRYDSLKITAQSPTSATYTARVRSTVIDTAGDMSTSILLETGKMVLRESGWKLVSGRTRAE